MLGELNGLMKPLARKIFRRMADIDRRLRGGAFPESVPLRSVERVVATLESYIDGRVNAEIAMLPPPSRWRSFETIYQEHAAVVWLLGTVVSVGLTVLGARLAGRQDRFPEPSRSPERSGLGGKCDRTSRWPTGGPFPVRGAGWARLPGAEGILETESLQLAASMFNILLNH